jgi:uncharacterized protein (TIGR00369 family)
VNVELLIVPARHLAHAGKSPVPTPDKRPALTARLICDTLWRNPIASQGSILSIWQKPISVDILTGIHIDTAVSTLGIEFLEVGDDSITARVPVDTRTRQPYGLLHGGVSVVLAETLGSCGAAYSTPEGFRAVGLDINANHIKGPTSGWVTGTARPVHIGRTTQVWQIELKNEAGELTCVSRITMAVLAPRG